MGEIDEGGQEYLSCEHWEMYRIVESLYCTPDINIILWVNYTGVKIKNMPPPTKMV